MARVAARLRNLCLPLAGRLAREEQGMGLIEVVVSATVVAILAVGLLKGFDVAGATSGTNKSRGVAASIAQDDQERMRGLEVRSLIARGTETRSVEAGSVTYTVKSTPDVIADSTNQGCTTGSGGIDYLKIRSEVTWPRMRIDPVVVDSFMAPRPGSFGPGEGGLSVQVVDRDAAPVTNLPVSLAGPGSFSDTTDENGCAFYTFIPAGDYDVSFSQVGKVTPGGVSNVSETVGVPEAAVSNKIFSYDTAARLTANFTTIDASGAEVPDRGTAFGAGHANAPAPGAPFFTNPSQVDSITTAFTLFPFTSPYSAYAGSCIDARPEAQTQQQTPRTILLDPGASGTIDVLEPSLDVLVRYGGAAVDGATVRFYDNSCGSVFTYPTLTGADGAAPGRVRYPGMPYGVYDICVDYDPPDSAPRRRAFLDDVDNTDPDREDLPVDIPDTAEADGSCPTA